MNRLERVLTDSQAQITAIIARDNLPRFHWEELAVEGESREQVRQAFRDRRALIDICENVMALAASAMEVAVEDTGKLKADRDKLREVAQAVMDLPYTQDDTEPLMLRLMRIRDKARAAILGQ